MRKLLMILGLATAPYLQCANVELVKHLYNAEWELAEHEIESMQKGNIEDRLEATIAAVYCSYMQGRDKDTHRYLYQLHDLMVEIRVWEDFSIYSIED